jgi:hypothetical protein
MREDVIGRANVEDTPELEAYGHKMSLQANDFVLTPNGTFAILRKHCALALSAVSE